MFIQGVSNLLSVKLTAFYLSEPAFLKKVNVMLFFFLKQCFTAVSARNKSARPDSPLVLFCHYTLV